MTSSMFCKDIFKRAFEAGDPAPSLKDIMAGSELDPGFVKELKSRCNEGGWMFKAKAGIGLVNQSVSISKEKIPDDVDRLLLSICMVDRACGEASKG